MNAHMKSSSSDLKYTIILCILVIVTFGKSIFGGFYYDDSHSIVDNVAVHSIKSIPSFWTDPSTSSFIIENRNYRPLTYSIFALCWGVAGGNPMPFHIIKLFMHFMVALAVFYIWRVLFQMPGWFSVRLERLKIPFKAHPIQVGPDLYAFILASVFAVHTACSECVDYVSATSSLQCAVFYVWAFYCYLVFRANHQIKFLAGGLFLYFCSVASKEEGITLPAMIFISEIFFLSGPWFGRLIVAIRRSIPYLIFGGLCGVWMYYMHSNEGNLSRGELDPFSYFMTQWRAYLWYMRIWFWPWDLNADNLVFGFSHSIYEPLVIQAIIGNILVIVSAWLLRFRVPAFLFGLVWFYVTISPASSIVVLAEPVNEHRMYLSYVGFAGGVFILLISLIEMTFELDRAAKMLPILYGLIMIGLFTGSQARNWVWENNKNLWTDTVDKNPTSGRAMNNLALVYMGEGDVKKGIELVERCERIWPDYMYCPLNRGLGFLSLAENDRMLGKDESMKQHLEQARISLQRARELNPLSVHTNYHLGRYFHDFKGDCNTAKFYYETAVQLNGERFPNGEAKLANCLKKLGQPERASALLKGAYELEPTNELVLSTLGDFEFEQGHLDKAAEIYWSLTKFHPEKASGFVGTALVAIKKGDYGTAVAGLKSWVERSPNSLQALVYLAAVQKLAKDTTGFIETENRYKTLSPNGMDFKLQVANVESTL